MIHSSSPNIGYYLEEEARLKHLPHEVLDQWIEAYPASFLLRYAKARKYILEGSEIPPAVLHRAAALSPDREHLRDALHRPPGMVTMPKEKARTNETKNPTPQSVPTPPDTPASDVPQVQSRSPKENHTTSSVKTPGKKKPKASSTKRQPEPKSFTSWLQSLSHQSKKAKGKSDKSTAQKRPKTKKRLQKVLKKIKPSPAEPVSETYADLLASQGHTRRAKEIYEKLITLYPEKKDIFAQKLENLKK